MNLVASLETLLLAIRKAPVGSLNRNEGVANSLGVQTATQACCKFCKYQWHRIPASSLPTFQSTLAIEWIEVERNRHVFLPLAPFRGEGVGG
jgi:hypothetical protein